MQKPEGREGVEKRKVQRLGTSSLVVTLPKNWVRQINLKPGDMVYVVTEGNTLRIIPGELPPGREDSVPEIDLTRPDGGKIASHLVVCMYVLGYNNVKIRLGDVDLSVINSVLSSASRLLGVEASCLGNNVVKMSVLIDSDKLDINSSITTMTRNMALMVEAILKTIKGERNPVQLLNDAHMLYNEIFRVQHSIMRQTSLYLQAKRIPLKLESPVHVMLLGSSLLGEAALIASRAAQYIAKIENIKRLPSWLEETAERTVAITEKLGKTMVTPDFDQAISLLEAINRLLENLTNNIARLKDPVHSYLASKLEDFLETLRITALITLCGAAQKIVEHK